MFGLEGVEHARDVLLDGRRHGLGVDHLGPVVGQFGHFLVAELVQAARVGYDARVRRHHAVDVGPDLDFVDP